MKRALHVLLFLLLTHSAMAQLSEQGIPRSFEQALLQKQNIDQRTMPAIPIASLHKQDALDAKDNLPPKFGHAFDAKLNLKNAGTWSKLPNGDHIWRLAIECPGATSINLLYDQFQLPENAQLFIYNKDKSQVLGAFTARNNKSDGKFGTGLVYGDHITLEYFLPKTARYQGQLQVSTIVHGYKTIDISNKDYGDAAACNVDVVCDSIGRSNQIKSVALMLLGGTRWCTGSLINNVDDDCKPLFLTANVCLNNYDAIDDPKASGFTFYWNYESPSCGGNDGPTNQSTTGATVLANSGSPGTVTDSDFALLELIENPADNYDVYFAGWDAGSQAPSAMYTIHHPASDVKKISTDSGPLYQGSFGNIGVGDSHWAVFQWDTGIMENGSTGAPMFDQNTGKIVGQHSGGISSCGYNYEDYFGKFSYSWLNNGATDPRRRLKDWLDPSNIGDISVDGSYSPCNPRPIISFTTTSLNSKEVGTVQNNCLNYREFLIDLQTTAAPQVPITIDLVLSGTAKEGMGLDYEIVPKSLVFPAGSVANQQFSIRITDDAFIESIENFEINYTLTTSGRGVTALSNNVFYGTISDNDMPPSLAGPSTTVQLVLEDFEDGAFPPNWTKSTRGTDSLAYKWGTAQEIGDVNSFFTVNPSNATNIVGSNDDKCNCDMSEDYLISPVFDLSIPSYGSASVSYDVYFEGLSYQGFQELAEVYATNDGGTTWVQIDNVPGVGPDGEWQTRTADLSDFLGDASVQVMFRYTDSGGFLFGVAWDNIHVGAEDRGPTDIQVPTNPVSFDEEYLGPNTTVHYYDEATGFLMATIENLSAHDYGCTSVRVDRSGTPYAAEEFNIADTPFYLASKTFMVTPQHNNPLGTYNISLYYTEAEVAGWENFTGQSRIDAEIVKANTAIDNVNPSNFPSYDIVDEVPAISAYTNSTMGADVAFTASFDTGFSGFGLGIYEPSLPISLLSFSGQKVRNTALLEWQTATEIDNDFFSLERSGDGINFSTIAEIQGAGNSISTNDYQYTDQRPLAGKNYYRLLSTDFDGNKQVVEDIVLISFNDLAKLEIYPNPVKSQLELAFLHGSETSGKIRLYDAAGRLVFEEDLSITEGTNRFELNLNGKAAGVYFVRLQLGATVKTRRFVKL